MGSAKEAVAYARSFVGRVKETPPGSNHTIIGKTFGWDGVAYCAEGMWVVLNHVHVPALKTASAHLLVDSGNDKRYGSIVTRFTKLEPGDICGWNYDADPNTIPNIHHVSMVTEKPSGGSVEHVGFNTSAPASGGSEWNGEGCWEKPYPQAYFCCALRPGYDDAKHGKKELPRARFTLELGDRGSDVRLWQRLLNIVDKAGLSVDGYFDQRTETATKAWQKAHGRTADGSVSLKAMRGLEQQVANL